MNQTQTKYARERATRIYRSRKDTLKEKFTTPAVSYSPDEKLELIRKGLFAVKEKVDGYYSNNYLSSYILFPEEKPAVLDNEGYKVAEKLLEEEFNHLMDELILGDEQEALQLLKAFEND